MALKSSDLRLFHELQNSQGLNFPQSACLLTENYGKLLDKAIMTADPFYAMSELFKFCAFSESQFLNMVESVLAPDTGFKVLDQGVLTLANLLYHQEILEEHALVLRELVDVIRHRGGLNWPKSPLSHRGKSDDAAARLQKDFEHLLSRTEYLLRRCENGMRVIMNNATIDQAQKAREQEKGMQSAATRFAFFYIPLSFVTGFYGMNFNDFGTGKLGLWVFFATAIPFLFISMLFLMFDIQKGSKRFLEYSFQLFSEILFPE
jgi:CorA-like Mg2+ transporter protein